MKPPNTQLYNNLYIFCNVDAPRLGRLTGRARGAVGGRIGCVDVAESPFFCIFAGKKHR